MEPTPNSVPLNVTPSLKEPQQSKKPKGLHRRIFISCYADVLLFYIQLQEEDDPYFYLIADQQLFTKSFFF